MKRKMKKLLSVLIFMLMLVFLHENVNAETMLYNDSNVSITYMGIEKEAYGDEYDINLVAENFSNSNIIIYVDEMSINEYMVNDPTCYIEISPGKKSRGSINIWGDDAKQNPVESIQEIEVKFRIYDDRDDNVGYESKRIRLHLTSNSSNESSQENSGSNGSSQNQQSIPAKTIKAKACSGFPSKINVPASLSQNIYLICSDGCGVLCTKIGQSYISDGTGSYSAQVYKMVFSKSGTHTVTAYDLFGNAVSSVIVEVSEEHSYGTFGKTITRPTCKEEGITEYTCNICGFKTIKTEPATGHSYNNGVVTKKPTCIENGTKTYTCTKCKDSYTEEIQATGEHSFSDWEISEEPTALEEGKETRTCLSCGEEESRPVEKLEAYVDISKNRIRIKTGKKFTLKIEDKAYGDVVKSWKISNKKVASIKPSGNKCVVRALKTGKATVTLTMKSGCKADCVIDVSSHNTKIKGNGSKKNPYSAYDTYTTDIYGARYYGKAKVKLIDCKDGEKALKYLKKNGVNKKIKDTQEYVYLKFKINYFYGQEEILADLVFKGFYTSNSDNQAKWFGIRCNDGIKDATKATMNPGDTITCKVILLVESEEKPVTYKISGYDKKWKSKDTWFTTKK